MIVLARLLSLGDKFPLEVMRILQSLELNFLPHLFFFFPQEILKEGGMLWCAHGGFFSVGYMRFFYGRTSDVENWFLE